MSSPMSVCQCWCHAAPDGIWYPQGVSVLDIIEAAVACDCCRPRHCEALLDRREPREKSAWVDPDPIKRGDDGEGVE